MVKFTGRATEIVTIPNKPTPTGLKVWNIAQRGFLLSWNFHKPGSKNGPVGVKVPQELGGSKSGTGGNKTQAVALHLIEQLPKAKYHVYMDNLFTSERFFELLRKRGYAATGTCRTNSGVISELVELKKNDKGEGEMEWGTVYHMPTESNLVNQVGFKDNAFALAMSTFWDGDSKVLSLRKRPRETSSKAKTARKPFGKDTTKWLLIPSLFDGYNFNMGASDRADQLAGNNSGKRRIKRGGWQAIEQWLLVTVLVNSYLIALYSGAEEGVKYESQDKFRLEIIEALLHLGKDAEVPRKRVFCHTNQEAFEVPIHRHQEVKMPTRKDCAACKGLRHWDRPPKRVALSEIAANTGRKSIRRSSWFGCKQCGVNLCNRYGCFERYHLKC
jgi:hypothetical protein